MAKLTELSHLENDHFVFLLFFLLLFNSKQTNDKKKKTLFIS